MLDGLPRETGTAHGVLFECGTRWRWKGTRKGKEGRGGENDSLGSGVSGRASGLVALQIASHSGFAIARLGFRPSTSGF
jgi:hypothetical protein